VEDYYREHLQELIARIPDNGGPAVAGLATAFLRSCDPARRDAAEVFVKERFGKLTGAQRVIARGLESYDQCIAAHKLLTPQREAWLAKAHGPHHSRQRAPGAIGAPAGQLNAAANSGMLRTTPSTRQRPGECPSLWTCARAAWGVVFSQRIWAQ